MIRFFEHYSLQKYHTFGTPAKARCFFEFTEPSDFIEFMGTPVYQSASAKLILGGGSNLLFRGDFDGLVLHPNIPGITIEKENRSFIWLRVGAGVEWDDFVAYAVRDGFGGVENLSLIPGKAGAAPVQNIGAYGQEAADVIESVTGIDLATGRVTDLSSSECRFGYRNSIFKNELKGRFLITSLVFRLDKFPQVNTTYRGVGEALRHIPDPGVADVRQAVIAIRRSKLPDPAELGNAGSFFKNPVVSGTQAAIFLEMHPRLPVYETSEPDQVKLSAGWLIDQCGWKGIRKGGAGVHQNHALVLVNHGNATGEEIFQLSEEIRQSVFEKFGVVLEREVNVI